MLGSYLYLIWSCSRLDWDTLGDLAWPSVLMTRWLEVYEDGRKIILDIQGTTGWGALECRWAEGGKLRRWRCEGWHVERVKGSSASKGWVAWWEMMSRQRNITLSDLSVKRTYILLWHLHMVRWKTYLASHLSSLVHHLIILRKGVAVFLEDVLDLWTHEVMHDKVFFGRCFWSSWVLRSSNWFLDNHQISQPCFGIQFFLMLL